MRGRLQLALAVAAVLTPAGAAAETIVVYELEDRRRPPASGHTLDDLADWLTHRVNVGTVFTAVDRETVADVIAERSDDDGNPCWTRGCKLDVGREVEAELVLETVIHRAAGRCAVQALVIATADGAIQRGATQMCGCSPGALSSALDRVSSSLKRQVLAARGLSEDDARALLGADAAEHVPETEEEEDDYAHGDQQGGVEDRLACDRGDGEACGRAAAGALSDPQAGLLYAERGCRLSDPISCRWAAKLAQDRGRTDDALKHARRGCRTLSDGPSCGWAASIELERNDRKRARESARRGCALDDPDACAWVVKLLYDDGHKTRALEMSERACNDRHHGPSCRWAASIRYEQGDRPSVLWYGKLGCDASDGAACSWAARASFDGGDREAAFNLAKRGAELEDGDAYGWVAKLEYEAGNTAKALRAARHGCERLRHGACCSWGASFEAEAGRANAALVYARQGAELDDPDSLSWAAKLEADLGNRRRALEYAQRGCAVLRHGPSCRWAASFEYDAGARDKAKRHAAIGCSGGDGAACSWVARIEYEARRRKPALEAAVKGCELNDGDSCLWAAKIENDAGRTQAALAYALRGCSASSEASCSLVRSLDPQ